MKKILFSAMVTLAAIQANAQTMGSEALPAQKNSLLNIELNSRGDAIRFGGFVNAGATYANPMDDHAKWGFDVRHADISIEGSFLQGKLGFFIQGDFADSYPLMDAWVSFAPVKWLKVSAGQKQTFTNNRSMMFLDQANTFGTRSLLDRTFSRTGRELGLFVESRLPIGPIGLDLGASVTSGDGRNSFGSSSTDTDKGGLKYGARATLYPLGFFKAGNELSFADFAREEQVRVAIGAAFSLNDGASNNMGEGHGDFAMYDKDGHETYPGYRKLSVDALMKYQGFSLMAEYVNTSGCNLDELYTAKNADSKLVPTQIADYLALGNGCNIQAGYLTRGDWAIDVAYSMVKPEFDKRETSVVRKAQNVSVGVSKYLLNNSIKIQLEGSYTKYSAMGALESGKDLGAAVNMQIAF